MKKTSFLVISLILVMGTLGIGYAAWGQALTINGTVNTGFLAANITDSWLQTVPNSTFTAEIGQSGKLNPSTGAALNDEFNIVIANAFPGYHQEVQFWVENDGTVPFYLANLTDTAIVVKNSNNDTVTNIINVPTPLPWSSTVLAPGDKVMFSMMLTIPGFGTDSFADPAPCAQYTVTVSIDVMQSLPVY